MSSVIYQSYNFCPLRLGHLNDVILQLWISQRITILTLIFLVIWATVRSSVAIRGVASSPWLSVPRLFGFCLSVDCLFAPWFSVPGLPAAWFSAPWLSSPWLPSLLRIWTFWTWWWTGAWTWSWTWTWTWTRSWSRLWRRFWTWSWSRAWAWSWSWTRSWAWAWTWTRFCLSLFLV